ncbi:MAG: hypothetical protein GXO22_07335 [Aquificae bacterium]|nr:hypothetical protein [Aquificota bacterium]
MIQVLGETEGLEGIKFSKFLKRATGSKKVGDALFKIGLVGTSAYLSKDKSGVNTSLLKDVIDSFLPKYQLYPEQRQTATKGVSYRASANVPMPMQKSNLTNYLLIGALGLAIFFVMRKK